jgi:hypothetical protein
MQLFTIVNVLKIDIRYDLECPADEET